MNESTRKPSRQPPWDGVSDREPESFGAWLRRERTARQVSIEEIADVTKISKTYLQALEDDRFDILPATVFAKGFLREYAKYVGLDADEVVNSYLTATQETEPDGPEELAANRNSSFEWTSGVLLAIALVLLLGAIGFLGFWAERSRQVESEPEAPVEAPAPPVVEPRVGEAVDSPTDGAEVEAAAPLQLIGDPAPPVAQREPVSTVAATALVVTIDFTEDCWLEVTVDGRRGLSELHVQGESVQLSAERRVELTLGNPAGVLIEVNGEPFSLAQYRPDRVARDIVIEVEDAG